MFLLDAFKIKTKIKGTIGYYGLSEWWTDTFSQSEREYISRRFQPIGEPIESLIKGNVSPRKDTVISFLRNLAGWYAKDKDRHLAHKMLEKAEALIPESTDPLDPHFLYQSKVMIYCMDRNKSEGLEKTKLACRQQIDCASEAAKAFRGGHTGGALPGHKGYQQLASILEEENKFLEAVDVCTEAMKQEWSGDWQSRIERCREKENNPNARGKTTRKSSSHSK